jgi:hypothetical protein
MAITFTGYRITALALAPFIWSVPLAIEQTRLQSATDCRAEESTARPVGQTEAMTGSFVCHLHRLQMICRPLGRKVHVDTNHRQLLWSLEPVRPEAAPARQTPLPVLREFRRRAPPSVIDELRPVDKVM